MSFIQKIKVFIIEYYCDYKSRNEYPENLKNGLDDIIRNCRKLKIAILDDHDFPYEGMLENEGCTVKYYKKYTKDINQPGQKLKSISLGEPDIIFCDINGIGEELYKDYKGLGVIENLREKHPFSAIYAYTGTPGFVTTKLKKETTIDGIFAKEWGADDFLMNFRKAKKRFSCPSDRWVFLRSRFIHLEASEKKIDELRISYVKSILLSKKLHQQLKMSPEEIKLLIQDHEKGKIDAIYWAKFGIKSTAEIFGIFSPLIME